MLVLRGVVDAERLAEGLIHRATGVTCNARCLIRTLTKGPSHWVSDILDNCGNDPTDRVVSQ